MSTTKLSYEGPRWPDFETFEAEMRRSMFRGGCLNTLQAVAQELKNERYRIEAPLITESRKPLASEQRRIDTLNEQDAKIAALSVEAAQEYDGVRQARTALGIDIGAALDGHASGSSPSLSVRDGVVNYATPRGQLRHESVYRPDVSVSFFRDLVNAQRDPSAAERLHRHHAETRDVTTGDPGAVGFAPPAYLGDLYAEMPRVSRPFADSLPKYPLPSYGPTLSIPRITTGTTTAVMATETANVSETDLDTATLSVPVVTIAGVNDVSLFALERTTPGLDFIIFQDLRADYDETLETQLFSGTGSNGQHLGIRAVGSIGSVTYTDSTPDGAGLIGKILAGVSTVATNRHRVPDAILAHPRRGAWLAAQYGATIPVLQTAGLFGAIGTQGGGAAGSISGIPVILSSAIGTTYGATTSEDELYVVYRNDMPLMEAPPVAELFRSIGGTETNGARLRLYGYSAFASGRAPSAICKVSGAGLADVLS